MNYAAPPSLLELLGLVVVLLLVGVAIAWPWINEAIDRALSAGEPDLDDEHRGGL